MLTFWMPSGPVTAVKIFFSGSSATAAAERSRKISRIRNILMDCLFLLCYEHRCPLELIELGQQGVMFLLVSDKI